MPTIKQSISFFSHYLKTLPDKEQIDIKRVLSGPFDDIFPALWSLDLKNQLTVPEGTDSINKKCTIQSQALRQEGNRLYKIKHFREALTAYNYALLTAPHPKQTKSVGDITRIPFEFEFEGYSDLAFAYANRSALLIEMEKYDLALLDIQDALVFGYTATKQHKMIERKIKCLINLRQFEEAKTIINNLETDVEKLKLEESEKSGLLVSLGKSLKLCDESKQNKKHKNSISERVPRILKIRGVKGENDGVSSALEMRTLKNRGRHLVARRNILPGELLAIEDSHSSFVTLDTHLRSYCSQCHCKTNVPIPCSECSLAVYCSRQCRSKCLEDRGGHPSECCFLPSLVALQPDMDVYLALRVIAATNLEELSEKSKENSSFSNILDKQRVSHSFLHSLEGHIEERSIEEKTEVWVTSAILLKLVMSKPHFFGSAKECDDVLTQVLVGKELMNLIFKIQCNAHCIKLLSVNGDNSSICSYNNVGFGIYGKMSLLNHSCSPNAHTSNAGRKKLLYSISSINKDEEITISYGERFVSHDLEERERNLRNTYFFSCTCVACTKKWPKFDELSAKIALRCCKCSGPIDGNTSKCKTCQLLHKPGKAGGGSKKKNKHGHGEQIPKNLYDATVCHTKLSKAWSDYLTVHTKITEGRQSDEDLRKLEQILSLLDKFAVLPNKPYIESQETLIKYYDILARETQV